MNSRHRNELPFFANSYRHTGHLATSLFPVHSCSIEKSGFTNHVQPIILNTLLIEKAVFLTEIYHIRI